MLEPLQCLFSCKDLAVGNAEVENSCSEVVLFIVQQCHLLILLYSFVRKH